MKKVVILYKFLPQYRREFFQQLKEELDKSGIALYLIHGKLKNNDSLKKDEVQLEWAIFVPNKVFTIGTVQFLWQPCLKYFKNADLVIVEQANKLLINYVLMFLRLFTRTKFAFWGHGLNLQAKRNSTRNKFKSCFTNNCDWWFAYTSKVKDQLVRGGYPVKKITTVQNAIDTKVLLEQYAAISKVEIDQLKLVLGIDTEQVGIFCGGMYAEKRIEFILDACHLIKKGVPGFHMLFLGSGIDANKIENAAKEYPWIHYIGPKFGKDRVPYFKISAIQLMPGLVGLGILDSFALETPIVTTDYPYHSPEIEYLRDNINGVITADSLDIYANRVIHLLQNKEYEKLIEGCKYSATKYTVEEMVENFKEGVIAALNN